MHPNLLGQGFGASGAGNDADMIIDAQLKFAKHACRANFQLPPPMKAIQGYHLIKPQDLHWRPSNLMEIPNADYLERTGMLSRFR